MKWLSVVLCLVFLTMALEAAPFEAQPAPSAPVRNATELAGEMQSVLEARTVALTELRDRYEVAPLEQRSALEAEGSRLQADYEYAYLTLAVEYYRVTGNTAEMERAQQMLDALDAAQTATTDVQYRNTDRNLPAPSAPADPNAGQEGVIIDAR